MANKDGIKSLMNYRYSKSPGPKVASKKLAPPLAKANPAKKSPAKAIGGGSLSDTIPDTPEKQWPSPLKVDKKISGTRKPIILDSDDDSPSPSPVSDKSRSQSSNHSDASYVKSSGSSSSAVGSSKKNSVASSPWLNASVGPVLMNGKSHSQRSTSGDSSHSAIGSSQDSTPGPDADEKWRERLEKVNNLKAAFPAHERDFLEEIWDQYGDYDAAVTAVITHIGNPVATKKRPVVEDDLSPIKAPQKKRIRIMSESSNEEQPMSSANRVREMSIRELLQRFPEKSREEAIAALEKHKYNLYKATKLLKDRGFDSNFVVSSSSSSRSKSSSKRDDDSPEIILIEHVPPTQPPHLSGSSVLSVSDDSVCNPGSLKEQKSRIKNNDQVMCIDSDSDVEVVVEEGGDDDDDDDDDEVESDAESDGEPADGSVLNFFNSATVDECSAVPGCSRKKAEAIIALQPFSDWADLTAKFSKARLDTTSMVSNCRELFSMREVVLSLMRKCRKISQQIEGLVSRLMSGTTVATSGDCHISKQPPNLNKEMELKPYQMVGLNWLVLLHGQQLNGILADEMGLGKTVQAISLLAHLLSEGEKGPHIIVVPSSTVDNWLRELRTWCPSLEVVLYYGSQEERRALRYQLVDENMDFNVLLTTYNMTCGTVGDRNLLKKFDFVYAIFDEAHMLKNMSSQRYASLMRTKASRRLLLTGTPLQNNLVELMSLLAFVMPHMFTSKSEHLKKMFAAFTKGDERGRYEKERIDQAKNIMKPFVLRRLKTQVLSQLPSKIDYVRKCPLTEKQRTGYDQCVERIKRRLADTEDTTTTANYLMELRKWANHPLLQRSLYTNEKLRVMAKMMMQDPEHLNANEEYVFEDMEVMSDFELSKTCQNYPCIREHMLSNDVICESGKFVMLDQLLPQMLENSDRVLLFSQFTMVLDVLEVYMKKRKYKYQRLDGQTPVIERQDLIDKYNNDRSIFVFLLSTRAGGLGINLTSANTVIMHDIDFNPYNDKQAEDRCHRVGQTRDVSIYRLISEGTIEEDILATAERKLQLEQDITGDAQSGDKGSSTDVASLLRKALHISKTKATTSKGT